ncbi:MAG: divergent polysaccharide deacetylase family protein [Pelosinus sp.]|nr:divergent polysaccharide deacetylase family protein [Pelosinus sp.]
MQKRSSANSRMKFVGVVLVLGILLAVAWYMQRQDDKPHYTVEKSGASTTIDFTAQAYKLHTAVDAVLSKAGVQIKSKTESKKEIPRQNVEGYFRWHARQIFVNSTPDVTAQKLQELLAAGIKEARGEVLAVQLDKQQGVIVEIGVRETIDGDAVTVITDRVYISGSAGSQDAANTASKQGLTGGKAKMAIVVDDFGYSQEPIALYTAIDRPLTFAVLPFRPFSNEAAARGLASGHQIILHLPLEPISQKEQSEENTITGSMSDAEIQNTVLRAIKAVPGIIGVNNHQGSRATSDRRVMKQVLLALKNNDLFFVDSRTSSKSVAFDSARQMGVLTTENHLFLDNSSDVGAIKNELRRAAEIALKEGSATFICHARPHSAQALKEMIPEIEDKGIRLVFVSQLLR